MCGNYKVFDGMLIELLSLVKYTKNPVTLYLMTMDLTEYNEKFIPVGEKEKNYLEEILKQEIKTAK